jgi:rSAM/selenodomain-associated transferase 1
MTPPQRGGGFAVIVLARLPRPGQAKTRLVPALGPQGAAALAARMLQHALGEALACGAEAVELRITPDGDEAAADPALQALQALRRTHPGLRIAGQGEGDLGQRMARALEAALRTHGAALLLGTDAPGLDAARIAEAAAALRTHDAVFVPALDGGYALVGLARPAPALFEGIAWSTPQEMAQTRARAASAGLAWCELAPVADIDEAADLVHVPPGWWPALGRTGPPAAGERAAGPATGDRRPPGRPPPPS